MKGNSLRGYVLRVTEWCTQKLRLSYFANMVSECKDGFVAKKDVFSPSFRYSGKAWSASHALIIDISTVQLIAPRVVYENES